MIAVIFGFLWLYDELEGKLQKKRKLQKKISQKETSYKNQSMKTRLYVLRFVGFLMFLAVLFPPYISKFRGIVRSRKWDFLFTPPLDMEIDLTTLFLEFILIGILGGLLYLFVREK